VLAKVSFGDAAREEKERNGYGSDDSTSRVIRFNLRDMGETDQLIGL
jgi:hypothetical protein